MSYSDSLCAAVSKQDWDVPNDLLPMTITNEASMLAGLDSDRMGCAAWD